MKYINPGLAELLDVDGGTTIEEAKYNPINGVALWQPNGTKGIILDEIPATLYGRFDVYVPTEDAKDYKVLVGLLGKYGLHGVRVETSTNQIPSVCAFVNNQLADSHYYYSGETGIKHNAINTIYFYVKGRSKEKEDGEYAVYVNGVRTLSRRNYNPWFDEGLTIVVSSNSARMPISNLIFSDSPIDQRERITAIPLGSPITDMRDLGDGTYLADSAGQSILQTVDVSGLIQEYGADSKVTGIAMAGSPAYCTAEGLPALVGISKSGDNIAEHGRKKLRQSITAGTIDCHIVDMTIADMERMQLGWKAGE